jgi:glycerol-3-phosphate O-acyltransferase
MDGISLKERFEDLFSEASKMAQAAGVITETNVYQEANPYARKMIDKLVSQLLLPDSRLEGRQHFLEFYNLVQAGKRGLILSEHYSNLDLPICTYLLGQDASEFGPVFSKDIVAIAGMKLNEDDARVKSMAEGFTRIVIYPSRSLAAIENSSEREQEEARSRKINMAAMRALDMVKKNHKPVLVFPSGTRYRPENPETKRGLREIDSYLRIFDVMILVTLNGSCLRFNPKSPNDMMSDLVYSDKVILASSPVFECKPFRNGVIESVKDLPDVDPKQATADKIMALLEEQHIAYEKIWQEQ